MKYPKTLRYWFSLRSAGSSLYVLIPSIVREFMSLSKYDQITFVYDTELKKITIRKVRK